MDSKEWQEWRAARDELAFANERGDGWRERCLAAEARVADLEDAVRALTADEVDDITIAVAQAMLLGSPETP
jgi:hypothetical protein